MAYKISFLGGRFGKKVAKEAKERIIKNYPKDKAMRILGLSDPMGKPRMNLLRYSNNSYIQGINDYLAVAINEILIEDNKRLATPSELENVIAQGFDARGFNQCLGLVIDNRHNLNPSNPWHKFWSENSWFFGNPFKLSEQSSYVREMLIQEVKTKYPEAKFPFIIPHSSLKLIRDENAPDKIRFKFLENGEAIHSDILYKTGYFSKIDLETGFPASLRKEKDEYFSKKGRDRHFSGTAYNLCPYNFGDGMDIYACFHLILGGGWVNGRIAIVDKK